MGVNAGGYTGQHRELHEDESPRDYRLSSRRLTDREHPLERHRDENPGLQVYQEVDKEHVALTEPRRQLPDVNVKHHQYPGAAQPRVEVGCVNQGQNAEI